MEKRLEMIEKEANPPFEFPKKQKMDWRINVKCLAYNINQYIKAVSVVCLCYTVLFVAYLILLYGLKQVERFLHWL